VSVAGKKISEPDDVAAAIQDRRPGESVEIELARGETVQVKLGVRP
jgi:putative serine protease PepD